MANRLPRAGATRSSGGPGRRRSPATAVLLALAAPALGMRLGFPDAGNDPPDTMTRQSYDLMSEGFGPGSNGPIVIAAELPDPAAPQATSTCSSTRPARRPRHRLRPEAGVQRRRRRGAGHRDPDHLAPGRGDAGPGQAGARDHRARGAGRNRSRRRGRRPQRGAGGPERLHGRPHAALHRGRRRTLLPAPADRLPLAADLAEGGDHEPALGQRRLRRDDPGRPGRLRRRTDRDRPRGADRAVHAGDDVRDPLRPLDGLRGLPDLAHPRGVPEGRRHPASGRRRPGEDGAG